MQAENVLAYDTPSYLLNSSIRRRNPCHICAGFQEPMLPGEDCIIVDGLTYSTRYLNDCMDAEELLELLGIQTHIVPEED